MATLYFTRSVTTLESDPVSPIADANKSAFSRANVFGLFLTLAFCLLLQPYGSLLYSKPHFISGRVVFFFWRLNPLACIMESALLGVAFIDGIHFALKRPLTRQNRPLSSWKHLRVTATAIQLLRAHGKMLNHWRDSVDNPQRARTGSSNGTALTVLGHSGSHVSETHLNTLTESTYATERRNSTDIESCDSTQMIASGTGLNMSRRAELAMNIIGTLGTLIIIIRLASITFPLHFRLCASFMITSWVLVQLAYLISDRGSTDSNDLEDLYRRAIELESRMKHLALRAVLSISVLPAVVYIVRAALYGSKHQPLALWITIPSDNLFPVYLILNDPFWWYHFPQLFPRRRNTYAELSHERFRSVTTRSLSTRKSILIIVLQYIKCFVLILIYWKLLDSIYLCRYSDKPSDADSVLPFAIVTPVIAAWMLLPCSGFMKEGGKGTEWVRSVSLTFNVVATLLFFAGSIMLYEEGNTNKPDWLEWFGKVRRL